MRYFLTLTTFLLFVNYNLSSQSREIIVKTTDKSIVIDGLGNDEAWKDANEIGDFYQYFPADTSKANYQTSVKIIRDKNNLYFLAKSFTKDQNIVVPSLRRDWTGWGIDNLTFLFDTFNDQTNGFQFGTNPEGVQRPME